MIVTSSVDNIKPLTSIKTKNMLLRFFLYGLLLPLGFAPFHCPGFAILSLAFFYNDLQKSSKTSSFLNGVVFGCGFFGLGISWIFVSIHDYGHINNLLSALITFLFIAYLSIFTGLMAAIFNRLNHKSFSLYSVLLFGALWIIFEYIRSTFLTGFPWLQLGYGQFDSPLRYLLPIVGVYGVGFLTCLVAGFLALALKNQGVKKITFLSLFLTLLLLPLMLKDKKWGYNSGEAFAIGIIQANMSMRDKWDEQLFWQLLQRYQHDTTQILGTPLIVMPESAIPLPASYVSDYLSRLNKQAKKAGSAILLGIPHPTPFDAEVYYNAMLGLGKANGIYLKRHLVPFGEYMPKPFQQITERLGIPDANLKAGKIKQPLLKIHHYFIASLICYEIAYGELLRDQLPEAQWIVSISDDGWFGHSLAMYQQQQMAQVRSLQANRYQVVANNDGLSSIIDDQGEIIASLPAFSEGILQASLYPTQGSTPWIIYGEKPVIALTILISLLALIKTFRIELISFISRRSDFNKNPGAFS